MKRTLSALTILALWAEVFAAAPAPRRSTKKPAARSAKSAARSSKPAARPSKPRTPAAKPVTAPAPKGSIPADYRAFLDAQTAFDGGKTDGVPKLVEAVFTSTPVSPLAGRAAVLAARALMPSRAADAAALLDRWQTALPQPEGDALLGAAAEATGDNVKAAAAWQRVYFSYPLSKETADAETALKRLRPALGDNYPPEMPAAILARADRLRRAGQHDKARRELLAAAEGFVGLEREQALVRANFYDRAGLTGLELKQPEADAERIYLLHALARRNSMEDAAAAALAQLESKYPKSSWTMEALISWGNHFSIRNEPAQYLPLYRRCADNFPQEKQAAYCHWKVTWAAWMAREPNAKAQMEEYVARYPDGDKASAALYFLGRYSECIAKWPMSYYTVLSRQKLGKTATVPKAPGPDPARWSAMPVTQARIARAKQLAAAGLPEWAEVELQFAAQEQPFVAAIELAQSAEHRGAHDQALRYIKGYAKGYLGLPYESAPQRFWKFAFPRPYSTPLEKYCAANGLDPHLVAGLVRQESEFNPRAVSRARAYGLTQVLPSTGRELYRRMKLGTFRTSVLTNPDTNLQLGTHYLKQLNTSLGGSWEHTLAAYNAGKSRVDKWKTWYDYREPAEFIECIPFSETREYVQVVLRNADMYRRLYAR
jgi:soluble lytic murein transglycosylase